MRIKKIHIQNYKSLVDFELDSPPPFCAFVGPNASGKSNIFEALEFINYLASNGFGVFKLFRLNDVTSFISKPVTDFINANDPSIKLHCRFEDKLPIEIGLYTNKNISTGEIEIDRIGAVRGGDGYKVLSILDIVDPVKRKEHIARWIERGNVYEDDYEQFFDNFSHIFVGNSKLVRINQSSNKLSPDASNLSQIIGQIFQDERKREDFIEWVQILIPEFKNIEVKKSNIDGSYEFFVYEKSSNKPFPKHLISDGTYNILALMAAVYQTSEPQFLCIEEPENGLHPEAIQLLVEFFREKCEDEGHHIWLNSHSQTLVRYMEIDELVLVNKINGQTRAKIDFKKKGIDIKTDEAWLTNSLGGGTLWSR